MISLRQTRLRTAIVIAATTAGVSVLVGVVWAFLAPAEHLLVVSEGRGVALTGESLHQFDASAVFIWLALIVGVLSAVAAWLARLSRGPYALGGLIVGSAAGAGLMALVGSGVTKLRFPTADNPAVGEIIARAPNIGTLLVLLFQPLAACVVTLVLAVLNPYDDLGVGDHPESGDPESGDPATEAEQADDEVQPKLP
ncbi:MULTISPECIES: DUF2567 domain-containing protein [Rhodococcus]|uniref:DUF2567 domain-containing protein n=1 Tax=Rhodococcus TaxID=1827 RepID=UPI000AAFCECC|nr:MULTISPECIES: DUF2567 domain-containing protein [Rhodococcus]MDJ0406447.1 DUF2567 domain-containing protein [Rhodococcus erythropolis]MDN3456017.1 DUF2567 domain-containing protein [Rhodococcus sp. APC 3903]